MSAAVRAWLLLVTFVLVLPAPASARVVHCGEVITADTRVDNDLVCPTPVALEIGAHGVDLDLRGHTIEAAGFVDENGFTYEEGEALRILGYDDVSVTNGTLIGHVSLGYGLHAREAERLSLRRLSTHGYASLFVTGDGARIVDVAARGFAVGITSSGATIEKLVTPTPELDVIGQAVEVTNGDFGNSAFFQVDGSSLRRNVAAEGFSIRGSGNSVLHNQGGWLSLSPGGGNTVRGNRLHALGLRSGSSGNLIRDNIVSGDVWWTPLDGIFVEAGATDNVLVGNSASGFADDGIDVEEPSTTLAGNRAFGNGDLGIEAVAGVIDDGGNRAWDNGNPLQCLNIDCG